jgi:ribonucleoside-triphosphate reductase (thioredoxin)
MKAHEPMTKNHLPTPLQEYVHKSRYAKWLDKAKRREHWPETVRRYVDYFGGKFPHYPTEEIYESIVNLETMPSMRALMTAGPALERDPMAGFNCSFVAIDDVRAFDEILYILMCGTGVGFSVERQFVTKLPIIGARVVLNKDSKAIIEMAEQLIPFAHTIVVRDSKAGWAGAFRELLTHLYAGHIPSWDVSKVRPAGAKLKTFGGRASGPQPLVDLFKFTVETFKAAVGRKLTSIECHDIVCKVADIVVVGGVRRSALISLSNLSDDRMRVAKSGQWWTADPQRALANNSTAYTERPQAEIFMKEWLALIESKAGERGIFNRAAAWKKAKSVGRRIWDLIVGTNPCAEISLRNMGLCNLSEIVVRAGDTLDDLKRKVRIAVIVGTYQSMLVNFRYVRSDWKKNQEEERLLGVSMTGIMDHAVLAQVPPELTITGHIGSGSESEMANARVWLDELREYAIEVNKEWATKLGINQSVAITTVKPSGTVSQLVDAASGKHERYSPFYIRTVRGDMKDPLTMLMMQQGFPFEPAIGKEESTAVFAFPVKAPADAVFRNDRTAVQQLEHYAMFQDHWSEHNVSNTIYVKDAEWLEVGAWVYKHFDKLAGVSFLPHSDHSYQQAPYTECTEAEYEALLAKMPTFDWDALANFEKDDSTVNTKELACSAGQCELV